MNGFQYSLVQKIQQGVPKVAHTGNPEGEVHFNDHSYFLEKLHSYILLFSSILHELIIVGRNWLIVRNGGFGNTTELIVSTD